MKISTASASCGGPLIPQGIHNCTLISCDLKRVKSAFAKSDDGKTDKWLWVFQSDQISAQTSRFIYEVWTNTQYGNEAAGLTKLLDMMIPDMTETKALSLDTDHLVGNRYRINIKHRTNDTSGKVYAIHVFIEPLDSSAITENRTLVGSLNGAMPRQEADSSW